MRRPIGMALRLGSVGPHYCRESAWSNNDSSGLRIAPGSRATRRKLASVSRGNLDRWLDCSRDTPLVSVGPSSMLTFVGMSRMFRFRITNGESRSRLEREVGSPLLWATRKCPSESGSADHSECSCSKNATMHAWNPFTDSRWTTGRISHIDDRQCRASGIMFSNDGGKIEAVALDLGSRKP